MAEKSNVIKIFLRGLLLFSILMVLFFVEKHKSENVDNDIKNNSNFTIGKIYYIKSGRQYTRARFYYYFYGNRYESSSRIENGGNKFINKFYKVEFSSMHPNYSKIFLDQEVTDTVAILKAGFSVDDIKNIKQN